MLLLDELKRRNVFKVGTAYLIVAWLLIQVAATVAPQLDFPIWVPRVITFVLLLGFPVALLFAWVFDRTPDGIKLDPGTRGNKTMFVVAAALVVLAIAWYYKGQPSYRVGDVPASSGGPSIAVLPFANMSGKADEDYFSDGMTEELLNVLAKIPKLNVAARTSVFEFKGKGGDVREIGRKLGVANIVEGSIRREGEQVRVTAQLIRVADGFHVWSETYERELKGVFALQDEIAKRIGEQLASSLGVAPVAKARAEIPPEAYDAYLKARALYRARKDLLQAIAQFQRAVALAPDFASGWSSLSLTYEVVWGYLEPAELAQLGDPWAKCREAALRANALEPDSAMTLHAMGNVARQELRFAEAERLYLRSIAVDPSYPDVREDYAEMLTMVGRPQDGLAAARQLVTLEPFVRNFWSRVLGNAIPLDRGDVVREAETHILAIQADHYDGIAGELQLHLAWGRVDQARAALAAAAQRAPALMADDVALMAWATRTPGSTDTAWERTISYPGESDPNVYAAMRGDAERVFSSYANPQRSAGDRRFLFVLLDTVPGRTLFADPRAKKLLREFGFEAYWREKGWPALCRPLGSDDFECGAAAVKG